MTKLGVDLPSALADALRREAALAAPRECCGLVEGRRAQGLFTIQALHRAANLSDEADRFEIDPRDHIAAVKRARAKGLRIVGCYHSHPHGEARPSAADLAGAGEEDFLWLIVAGETVAAFLHGDGEFHAAALRFID